MKKIIAFFSFLLLPGSFAFAQNQNAFDILDIIQTIFNTLVPILVALATLFVIWKAIQFARAEGDDKAEKQSGMISAIIALFVLVSIWGLVAILNNTFGISQGTGPSNLNNFGCYDPNTNTVAPQNC